MKSKEDITIVNKENSIKKSNEISKAKLFYGLTLNQMQLFSYAIYITQKNSDTAFRKVDFEKKFNIEKYQTRQAKHDSRQLMSLAIELKSEDTDSFKFRNVFNGIDYEKGKFTFEWSNYIKPHILELKNKFIETDLTITMHFRSSFSWTLYDLIKASYGRYYLEFAKEELMVVFSVDKVKSYKENTSLLKKNVLDIAVEEVNRYTEYRVHYEEIKKGRAIIGFKILFDKGATLKAATKKQISYLKDLEKVSREKVIIEILTIEDKSQRGLATEVIKDILVICEKVDESLTLEEADSMIKKINEKTSYIRDIIKTEIKNQNKNISDPYNNIDIPIFNFFES